jgi:YggT family protein
MDAIFGFLFFVINAVLEFFKWALIIWAILSWLVAFNVVNVRQQFVGTVLDFLNRLAEPLCRPIRRVMPDLGGIDLSPMIVILLIIGIQNFLLPGLFSALI